MQYLTYEQYQVLGGELSAEAFTPLEFKCRKRIDRLTDCRVQAMAEAGTEPEEVRFCMFTLMELESRVGTVAQVKSPVATSFSTDGYSEHYGNVLDTAAADAEMDKTVRQLLYGVVDDHGVPLLYRGV